MRRTRKNRNFRSQITEAPSIPLKTDGAS